ncbi:MAG: energy-coupling factor ABC transporter ATP-binding protein [Aigarchaeota archaeon]|nr:energy-coupling factor ABC transporter ATP-binding protein [Candidatus Calditenuaceae archaeon]
MIELDSVWFSYPTGTAALRGVSLFFRCGEIVALMGENGAGKTTLLKHLNGLLKPTKGRVTVDGIDTRTTTVATLSKKVGLVFQNPDNMFLRTSVLEEVSYALEQFGAEREEARRRAGEVLKAFELWHYRDSSPFTLSGGEKKKLAISIVMAWMPKYIAIDEPTSGLDGWGKRVLAELLLNLKNSERGIILSSHDVEFVSDVATRVVLLRKGEVISDGAPEDVLTEPELLSEASLLTPQIPSLLYELRSRGLRMLNHKLLKLEEAVETLSKLLSWAGHTGEDDS